MDPLGKQPKRVRIFASATRRSFLPLREKTRHAHEPVEAEVRAWDAEAGELRPGAAPDDGRLDPLNRFCLTRCASRTRSAKRSDLGPGGRVLPAPGSDETAPPVDGIGAGFDFATRGGMTIGLFDIEVPKDKPASSEGR
jgi:hypothetical protein